MAPRAGPLGDPVALSQQLLLGVVIVTLVFAGPLVPGLSFVDGDSATLGDGDAEIGSVKANVDEVAITPGRFGTDVLYLRIPDATVSVTDIAGKPRLVYQLEVPALDVEETATRLLAGPGGTTLRLDDVAFPPDSISAEQYTGMLSVRVQSFSTDRTVFNDSVTIEVRR